MCSRGAAITLLCCAVLCCAVLCCADIVPFVLQSPTAKTPPEVAPPGRIDNGAMMPSVLRQLKDGLKEGVDFVAVSEKSWERLHHWCAPASSCITQVAAFTAAASKRSCSNAIAIHVAHPCAGGLLSTGQADMTCCEVELTVCFMLASEPAPSIASLCHHASSVLVVCLLTLSATKRRYGGGPEIRRFWRTVQAGGAEEPRLVLMTYPLRTEVLRKLKGPTVAEVHVEKTVRSVPLLQPCRKLCLVSGLLITVSMQPGLGQVWMQARLQVRVLQSQSHE